MSKYKSTRKARKGKGRKSRKTAAQRRKRTSGGWGIRRLRARRGFSETGWMADKTGDGDDYVENPSTLSFNGILALAALAAGIYWYKNRQAANPT